MLLTSRGGRDLQMEMETEESSLEAHMKEAMDEKVISDYSQFTLRRNLDFCHCLSEQFGVVK